MATVFYDRDADLDLIRDKCIAIIGYGNQGRAQALNMRDSGIPGVIVGSRRDESYEMAEEDGFPTFSIKEAAEKADVLFLLVPDEFAPGIFESEIRPGLREGNIINFASAYNITFNKIVPPENVDVVMAAPRMIGDGVRNLFLQGDGATAFCAVHQDWSGKALEYAKALCKGIGCTRKGSIEVEFIDETMLDLVAEQGVWPIFYHVFNEAFKLLVSKGHPEEAVLLDEYLSKEPMYILGKAADTGLFLTAAFPLPHQPVRPALGIRTV